MLFLPPYTRGEKKNIWSELESNPGPLASQAAALTTKPWLLGPFVHSFIHSAKPDEVIAGLNSWVWRPSPKKNNVNAALP